MFKVGDKVVIESYRNTYISCGRLSQYSIGDLMIIRNLEGNVISDDDYNFIDYRDVRHATEQEIAAGHRIDHISQEGNMVDANAGVTVITPKETSKVKGGMTAFVDMGDDSHIENHISPLCKTEGQPVFILERDNQIIERLKAENVVLQAKVDELQVENKILNQAASTHLKNQMHFKKLYDALVEQLYPYAIDLEEPVDGDVNITPQEFINGYSRARECVHYNLLEMMESDEEYIRAQCGMLGGGES